MPRHIVIISNLPTDEYHLPGFPSDLEQIEAGLRAHVPEWRFSHLSVQGGQLPPLPEQVDGLILSGSPSSVNDDAPWIADILSLIRELYAKRVPMLGICFGHQAIAKALGGRVVPREGGWSLGVKPVTWGEEVLPLCAVHTEEVVALPQRAEVLARTDNCPVSGFQIGTHVLTTQHHPEMSHAFLEAVLDKLEKSGEDGPDATTLALARASLVHKLGNTTFMEKAARFLGSAM